MACPSSLASAEAKRATFGCAQSCLATCRSVDGCWRIVATTQVGSGRLRPIAARGQHPAKARSQGPDLLSYQRPQPTTGSTTAVTATGAPSATNRRAVARRIPLVPPVTSAISCLKGASRCPRQDDSYAASYVDPRLHHAGGGAVAAHRSIDAGTAIRTQTRLIASSTAVTTNTQRSPALAATTPPVSGPSAMPRNEADELSP